MATTSYAGRTVDLMMTENYSGLLGWGISSQVVTGVQKLVQIFIYHFLNGLSTSLFSPAAGTIVGSNIKSFTSFNESSVKHYINLATMQAYEQIRENEDDTMPNDERLSSATPYNVKFDNETLSVYFEIETIAESSMEFVIPVNLPIV